MKIIVIIMMMNIFREFRDVVFEDVVLDDNGSVAPYQVNSKYRIRLYRLGKHIILGKI